MTTKPVVVVVDRSQYSITPGAVRGRDLRAVAQVGQTDELLLEVKGDVDVPMAQDDIVFVRGGEVFSIGTPNQIPDNPQLRKPIAFSMNDSVVPGSGNPAHAKFTGADLKKLVGASDEDDLWCDLDGLADVLLDDDDRVVVQQIDHFFTVHREDNRYHVTVLLDGEARERDFPTSITVRQAIRRSLPPSDRDQVDSFAMTDANQAMKELAAELTLHNAGVRDGHVLSITKKSGGGGSK
ncbi:hypothetical protein Q8F57_009895 [Paraburkholderia terrae]|uniref:hypothetical protein n=1 Tax=Paraburkholderia terrae TaxID=311230 RepID=UPI00296B2F70|nr:hypothetical protein [Paraburkholderia terrae]MDW3660435.1 hypothetical protein [Paraburkholderia terrae]